MTGTNLLWPARIYDMKILITERKIIRRIFSPTEDTDGKRRITTNDELNNLIINKNVIVVCFLLGNSPASEFYMPTFRNTLSVPSS
jgi:hypothetical protein